MRVVPSDPVSPLVRQRLEQLEALNSEIVKSYTDTVKLRSQAQMCVTGAPPAGLSSVIHPLTGVADMSLIDSVFGRVVSEYLPDVCKKHLHEFKHQCDVRHAYCDVLIYAKWTFYNDQSVILKFTFMGDLKTPIAQEAIRSKLVMDCDDYESWQADAIMRCEAGEDIWERPKRVTGNFSAQAAGLASLGQQQSLAGMQQAQAARQNALGNRQAALTGGGLSLLGRSVK